LSDTFTQHVEKDFQGIQISLQETPSHDAFQDLAKQVRELEKDFYAYFRNHPAGASTTSTPVDPNDKHALVNLPGKPWSHLQDPVHKLLLVEVLPGHPWTLNPFIASQSEMQELLARSSAFALPTGSTHARQLAEQKQEQAFTEIKLSREKPTDWFIWIQAFDLQAKERGWLRRGVLTHIPVRDSGNPGLSQPSPTEAYGEVLSANITYNHVLGFRTFLLRIAESNPSTWINYLIQQRQHMARAILKCLSSRLKTEVVTNSRTELNTDGTCLLRWLRDHLVTNNSDMFGAFVREITDPNDSLDKDSTPEQVFKFISDRQTQYTTLSRQFDIPTVIEDQIRNYLKNSFRLISNSGFKHSMSSLDRKPGTPMETLPSVTTWLSTAMEAWSQNMVSPATTMSNTRVDTQQPRAMVATTNDESVTLKTILGQLAQLSQDIHSPAWKKRKNQDHSRTDDEKKRKTPSDNNTTNKRTGTWKKDPMFKTNPINATDLCRSSNGITRHFCVIHKLWTNHATVECSKLGQQTAQSAINEYFEAKPAAEKPATSPKAASKYKSNQAITSSSRETIVHNESFEQEPFDDTLDSPLDDEEHMVKY